MYYKELLRVRHALLLYLIGLVVTALFITIVNLASGSHVSVTVGDVPKVPAKVEAVPWVALFAGAGFLAAIMATVFGSTLSQEADHLALAWTKPRSRTEYATTVMLVDAAGIVISQLLAFAFILGVLLVLAHNDVRLVAGRNDLFDLARFMLFPLAWYGLIVALSARLRNRAGVVQGLIWPASFVLAGFIVAPVPPVMHEIIVLANYLNPLVYTSYVDTVSATHVNATPNGLILASAGASTLALAAYVVICWFVATSQWRKLEA